MRTIILILAFSIPFSSLLAEKTDTGDTEEMEEISVIGRRSLLSLRLDVYRREDDFYRLFNALNTDDDYDVNCDKETRTGSHLSRRVCKANFVKDATALEARQYLLGIGGSSAAVIIMRKQELLNAKMTATVQENPELLEKLLDLDKARKRYEAERNVRFK